MSFSHIATFVLLNMGSGLTAPVLSLLLMARGATLETLPLAMGITIAVTAALEVPSGVAADLLGRKRLFLVALALQAVAFCILGTGSGIIAVLASCMFRGAALAARTGTLEAVELDAVVAGHDEGAERLAALDRTNGTLALTETIGVGLGSIAGSALAALDPSYTLLIAGSCGLTLFTGIMALASFRDTGCAHNAEHVSLAGALAELARSMRGSGDMRAVLAGSCTSGAAMVAVETYWQPAFVALAGTEATWALGPISCLAQAAATFGSMIASRWGARLAKLLGGGRPRLYRTEIVAMLCLLAFLGFAPHAAVFAAAYIALYSAIGARSVTEQTMLHDAVPASERAGAMSVQSLALRLGGVAASTAGGAVAGVLGIFGTLPLIALMGTLPLWLAREHVGN